MPIVKRHTWSAWPPLVAILMRLSNAAVMNRCLENGKVSSGTFEVLIPW